ncbi:MAG: CHASE3 domain-containing protein [Verrucomicrobia bacterium]|nr:CHASE3 domain-containing protein [Verrucomicrobiota bacterium]
MLSVVFVAAVTLLAATVVVCLLSVRAFFQDIEFAESTDDFLHGINDTLSLVKDAEMAHRGYLLTGDAQFLDPYRSAVRSLEDDLPKLAQQATRISPDYRDQSDRYVKLVREHLSVLAVSVEARRGGEGVGPATLRRNAELMDQVRSAAANLISAEQRRLGARSQQALDHLRLTYASFAAAAVLDLILLVVLWWTGQQERHARAESERVNHLKDEFLATLSHELRTPIHAVLGWVNLMTNEQFVDLQEIRRGLKIIEKNAEAQAELVDELLDLSRIIAGRLRLELEPLDLATVVRSATDTVQIAANQKAVRITPSLAPNTGPVLGDPARMQQVVWNLLSNAIKFTPQGGRVDVTLRGLDSHVELTVSDNGIGIRKELLPHVFERFRQGDSSLTRKHGGLGIGLALVKSLVEMHGGSIEAHSPGEGQGATFVVRLPVKSASTAPLAHLAPLRETRAQSSPRPG